MSISIGKAEATAFAQRMVDLGFQVYLAKEGTYGFVTDSTQARVLSFSFSYSEPKLSGQYGPPSAESGTGWRLEQVPSDLVTKKDVIKALYEMPPAFCGRGWTSLTTVDGHLAAYGNQFEKFVSEQSRY